MNRIWESHLGLDALNSIVFATLFLTTVGPLAGLVGVVIWAQVARVGYVAVSGAASASSAILLNEMLKSSSVHDSRMMLVPGFWACTLASVFLFSIAAARYIRSAE